MAGEVAAAWGLCLVPAGAGSTAGVLALLQPTGQPGAPRVILAGTGSLATSKKYP